MVRQNVETSKIPTVCIKLNTLPFSYSIDEIPILYKDNEMENTNNNTVEIKKR